MDHHSQVYHVALQFNLFLGSFISLVDETILGAFSEIQAYSHLSLTIYRYHVKNNQYTQYFVQGGSA